MRAGCGAGLGAMAMAERRELMCAVCRDVESPSGHRYVSPCERTLSAYGLRGTHAHAECIALLPRWLTRRDEMGGT